MKPTRVIPFDTAHIAGADEFHRSTAEQFRQAIGPYVFMSLGASQLAAVPGRYDRGGLLFTARILPFTRTGDRYAAARNMAFTGAADVGAPLKGLVSAACRAPAAARSVLDGTQPMFTHVPPRTPRSTSTTLLPAWLAAMAADIAAPPEPITARSTS